MLAVGKGGCTPHLPSQKLKGRKHKSTAHTPTTGSASNLVATPTGSASNLVPTPTGSVSNLVPTRLSGLPVAPVAVLCTLTTLAAVWTFPAALAASAAGWWLAEGS